MSDDLTERTLVRAWQRGLPDALRTTDGRALSIVYRGRCPGGAGPDVRGALLVFDGGMLVEGDVEFHRSTSDWFAHRHHRDAQYHSVTLHVVLVDDAPSPASADGQSIPTLIVPRSALDRLASPDVTEASAAACHRSARERPTAQIGEVLDSLGDRRLTQHAARFEAELTHLTPEQLAYEALFDALGFSRNRGPFVRLAQAVPIDLLGSLLGRRVEADARILAEAILFGVAGLLPSQRSDSQVDWQGDAEVADLEAVWRLYQADWAGFGLTRADWIFGGVRPANYPTRRIATAVRLILRFRDVGLDTALLAPLRTSSLIPSPSSPPIPSRSSPQIEPQDNPLAASRESLQIASDLQKLLLVDDPGGYWSSHGDFGQALPGAAAALLGRDRARDAVVNVVLPLALAVAATTDDRSLADAAWTTYRAFPRPAAYDAIQKLSADLGLPPKATATARRQQGLLQLLRAHCEQAGCSTCPLARNG